MHDPVAGRAPAALPLPVRALDQDLESPALEAAVDLAPGSPPEGRAAAPGARRRPASGTSVSLPHRAAAVPGPRRVAEGEEAREAHVAHELERRLEVLLGLPGKAHDEVGGERESGHRARACAATVPVVRRVVPPLHPVEDAVRARLRRQVKVRRDDAAAGERLEQGVVHEARMRGQKAQAPEPRDPATRAAAARPGPSPSSGSR